MHHRSDQHHIIDAAADNNISDVRTIFDSLDWSEENYRMLEEIGQSAEQVHICLSNTDEVSVQYDMASYSYIDMHENCCLVTCELVPWCSNNISYVYHAQFVDCAL